MSLEIEVRASFGAEAADAFTVEADLAVERGETLVVLGPSGSGKSLLLETVAGFHPHEGRVALDGRELGAEPPEERGFGFVFQDYALFPHMTARENVAFGRRYRRSDRDPDDLLAAFGVRHLADRSPPTLSGGEQQRIALARALAVDPDVLLLDEPLSSLDVPTRQALRNDLADALDGVTAVYVTHDRTTARALADRIAVMGGGEIVQTGTPADVFERPASPFVAEFTGSNCVPLDGDAAVARAVGPPPGGASAVAIRPEYVVVNGADASIPAAVERVAREDAAVRVTLSLVGTGARVDAFVGTDAPPTPGEEVALAFPAERLTFL